MTSVRKVKLLALLIISFSKIKRSKAFVTKSSNNLDFRKPISDNFLACPLSVEVAFGLIQVGARGETARQISDAIHLPKSQERTIQAYSALGPTLQSNEMYSLNTANKIYVGNNFQLSESYKHTAINTFRADIQSIDLKNRQQAALEINNWITEKTRNKVRDMMSMDKLDEDSRLLFVNAMYFGGQWITQFNTPLTTQRPFYLDNNNYVNVDMMEITNNYNYFECPQLKAQFLEMPYDGNNITMTIVLPNQKEGLPTVESQIAQALIGPKYEIKHVNVRIPKYQIETTIDFTSALKSMGMELPLGDGADFSGIVGKKDDGPLIISEIIQRTCIEVDEKGTTISNDVPIYTLKDAEVIQNKTFYADHPFLFYLKHRVAGISFIGRYTKAPGEVKTVGSGLALGKEKYKST